MIYLVLATCVNLIMVFTFKVAHLNKWNARHLTLVNYICAFSVCLAVVARKGMIASFGEISHVNFATLFTGLDIGNTMFIILISGIIIGIFYVLNILLMNANVKTSGSGMTTLFGRSGFLLTITVSVIFFQEQLGLLRISGVAVTLLALIIASGIGSKNARVGNPLMLFSMTFVVGVVEVINKAFTIYAIQDYKSNLMLITFAMALLMYSSLSVYWSGKNPAPGKWKWQEIAAGMCMGLPNAFGNVFQIMALERLPTAIVFPSIAAGNLLVSTIISRFVFKEDFGARKLLAVVLTIISLVLVNLGVH